MKGISAYKHLTDFVLWDYLERYQVLQNILERLPTDVQSRFTVERYTVEFVSTFPCICLCSSGEYSQFCCCLHQPSLPSLSTFELVCVHLIWLHVHCFSCDFMCVGCAGGCVVWSWTGFTAWSTLLTTTRSNLDSAQTQCNLPR